MATKTPKPSLDQQRAAYAWKKVQGCGDEYGKLAKGAPALIMNNGLMQTLAFYEDKGKNKPHQKLLNRHIIGWLTARFNIASSESFESMMVFLQEANSQQYRKATEEALALLRWIRQFAAINQ